ncbi:MAG: tol-pal system-associated acyl-CoA thioesterase [Verrucomicrobiota bacterium]
MSTEPALSEQNGFVGHSHYYAVRVYTEDTDLGGVVYHANYLRFLERARSEMLRCLGIHPRAAFEAGQGIYAVTEIQIKYCRPARLEDDLVVKTDMTEIRGATSVLRQEIRRAAELLVEASVTVAFLSPNGRPRRQPSEWVAKFKPLQMPTL